MYRWHEIIRKNKLKFLRSYSNIIEKIRKNTTIKNKCPIVILKSDLKIKRTETNL